MSGNLLFWLALLVLRAPGDAPPECFCRLERSQIARRLAEIHRLQPDIRGRLLEISAGFLGVRYQFSPLGEGPGSKPDPDPLLRFDRVDCQTLVEETLALSLSPDLERALEILNRIRYLDGQVEYARRKHFVVAQWLPDNQRLGLFEDISERIGGPATVWQEKTLDERAWRDRRPRKIWPQLAEEQIPQGTFRLPLVPLRRAVENLHLVPAGSIMLVVREVRADKPESVSHMGLVVENKGRLYLRHASRKAGRVVDQELDAYLSGLLAYRRWPVKGVNFQLPRGFDLPTEGLNRAPGRDNN